TRRRGVGAGIRGGDDVVTTTDDAGRHEADHRDHGNRGNRTDDDRDATTARSPAGSPLLLPLCPLPGQLTPPFGALGHQVLPIRRGAGEGTRTPPPHVLRVHSLGSTGQE